MLKNILRYGLLMLVLAGGLVRAEQPWTFSNNTRYLSIGDSLAAGYGAIPTTQGFAYLLYQKGTFDNTTNTLFANAAVPGATTADVLAHQVPQAIGSHLFRPQVITLSVGGNDLLAVLPQLLQGGDPVTLLTPLFTNLRDILIGLCQGLPNTRIYIGNLYTIQNFPVSTDAVVAFFNQQLELIVGLVNQHPAINCPNRVRIADVFSAFGGFDGPQDGLLLVNRNEAGIDEVHPSNAGYRAMAAAYEAAHKQ